MITYLWIALGSALGGMARYACSGLVADAVGERFPWGTLAVNVAGSLVIGLFIALTGPGGRWSVSPNLQLFVTVGVCGGYTTFSSFSFQTLALLRGGEVFAAGAYVVASVALCLAFVWLGYLAGGAAQAQ